MSIYLTEDAVRRPTACTTAGSRRAGFSGGQGRSHELADHTKANGRPPAGDELLTTGSAHRDLSEATSGGHARTSVRWIDVRIGRQSDGLGTRLNSPMTRSPGRGNSRVNGGATTARTSCPASPVPETGATASNHDGQVWFYNPRREDRHAEDLIRHQSAARGRRARADGPDNITVSPHGGLILAEDGRGIQHLIGVSAERLLPIRWPAMNQSQSGNDRSSAGLRSVPTAGRPVRQHAGTRLHIRHHRAVASRVNEP